MSRSGFTLDQITHRNINFLKLTLRGNSYIKLSKWIAKKKNLINLRNNDEGSFKWAFIAKLDLE